MITADTDRLCILAPFVVYTAGRYCMWHLAGPHEIGPGEQPDYELRCTDSEDGITDWTPPTVFADTSEGFFDVTLIGRGDTSAATRSARRAWCMTDRHPSADRSDWSTPLRLIDSDAPDIPEWFARPNLRRRRRRIQRSSIAHGDRLRHRDLGYESVLRVTADELTALVPNLTWRGNRTADFLDCTGDFAAARPARVATASRQRLDRPPAPQLAGRCGAVIPTTAACGGAITHAYGPAPLTTPERRPPPVSPPRRGAQPTRKRRHHEGVARSLARCP